EALKEVTLDGLQAHFESVLGRAYVKMLVSGNYTQSVALDTSNQVLDILQHQPTPRYLINAHRSLNIEPGYYVQNVPISDEKCLNSAVVSTFYCGSVSDTRDDFICDYRKKLQEMTVEEFESSVQSLISLKEEKLKSIDDEFSRLWTHINLDKYMFYTLDKEVEQLKQLGKDDLLSFWDKYFNKDTAQRYTRLDMQMWSAKLWQPTPEEFEMYPSSVLSLYGCLRSGGHTALSIAEVYSFLLSAAASSSIDTVLGELSELYMSKQAPSTTADSEGKQEVMFESVSKIATALQMVIDEANAVPKPVTASKTNFASIDMKQSPDGVWLINDYTQFKSSQALHGLPVPTRSLVPVVPEPVPAEVSEQSEVAGNEAQPRTGKSTH
ncbi:metalloprotease, partial [Coemansia sp. RSA 2671]